VRTYTVHVDLNVAGVSADGIAAHGGLVMEALADLDEANPELQDWTVSMDAAQGRCEIDLTVTAAHHADAVALAHSLVRTAIHAAGGATPEGAATDKAAQAPRYDDAENAMKVFA
jgi:hypothetical protein